MPAGTCLVVACLLLKDGLGFKPGLGLGLGAGTCLMVPCLLLHKYQCFNGVIHMGHVFVLETDLSDLSDDLF